MNKPIRLRLFETDPYRPPSTTPCVVYPTEPVVGLLTIEGPRAYFALPLSKRALEDLLSVLKKEDDVMAKTETKPDVPVRTSDTWSSRL